MLSLDNPSLQGLIFSCHLERNEEEPKGLMEKTTLEQGITNVDFRLAWLNLCSSVLSVTFVCQSVNFELRIGINEDIYTRRLKPTLQTSHLRNQMKH